MINSKYNYSFEKYMKQGIKNVQKRAQARLKMLST